MFLRGSGPRDLVVLLGGSLSALVLHEHQAARRGDHRRGRIHTGTNVAADGISEFLERIAVRATWRSPSGANSHWNQRGSRRDQRIPGAHSGPRTRRADAGSAERGERRRVELLRDVTTRPFARCTRRADAGSAERGERRRVELLRDVTTRPFARCTSSTRLCRGGPEKPAMTWGARRFSCHRRGAAGTSTRLCRGGPEKPAMTWGARRFSCHRRGAAGTSTPSVTCRGVRCSSTATSRASTSRCSQAPPGRVPSVTCRGVRCSSTATSRASTSRCSQAPPGRVPSDAGQAGSARPRKHRQRAANGRSRWCR